MDTAQIIWIIIGVVVLLALIGLAMMVVRKRQQSERREQAAGMRQDARAQASSGGMQESELQAKEARLEVERARVEAERADTRAAEAEKGHLQEKARQEDQVREADRLDPEVDHRSPDYRPEPPATTGSTAGDDTPRAPATEQARQQAAEDPVHEPPPGETDTGGTHRRP